jgi:hypothetical protein
MNNPLPATDEPLLIISGLPSSEPTPAWVQAWSSAGVAQWVPPQALLGPRGAALADSHARIVWLYRAPWGSVGPAGMRLGSWLSLQRQALRQRGQNPGAWVLVNADRLDPEALADHLGPNVPVYGIFLPYEQALVERAAHGPAGLPSVEEMAADYVKTMRAQQPSGPYCLAGVSFGGMYNW